MITVYWFHAKLQGLTLTLAWHLVFSTSSVSFSSVEKQFAVRLFRCMSPNRSNNCKISTHDAASTSLALVAGLKEATHGADVTNMAHLQCRGLSLRM